LLDALRKSVTPWLFNFNNMQNDEMIWQVINHQFCSFKTTIGKALSDKTHFCRHPYSVTGLCNRTSCPLANSKYATLREDKGRIYLCMKTVERAHSPKNLWERVLLSRNYTKALAQIDEHLQYFPTVLIHRNKQRLTKIHQYLIRMRKIELKQRAGKKAKLVSVVRRIDQREEKREKKALVAAKIEANIEKELVERLAKGTYGDIYNFHESAYKKALDQAEELETEEDVEDEDEAEDGDDSAVEYVEDLETDDEEDEEEIGEDMEDMDYLGNGEWGRREGSDDSLAGSGGDSASEDSSDSDDDDDDDDSDRPKKKKPAKKPARKPSGPRIEIEYEEEREDAQQELVSARTSW
jgi:protein MAK16